MGVVRKAGDAMPGIPVGLFGGDRPEGEGATVTREEAAVTQAEEVFAGL